MQELWNKLKDRHVLIWMGIVAVVFSLIFLLVGILLGRNASLEETIRNDLVNAKASLDQEYQQLTDQVESQTIVYDAMSQQIEEGNDIISQAEEKETELDQLNQEIEEKQANVSGLDEQITVKQSELDRLNGDILKAQGQPISLPAGQYVVGQDIAAGRYVVSGRSNFVTYSSSGALKINVILGDSFIGSGDYVGFLEMGDMVESQAPVTLTPVE
jgi:hypothetical protein